MWMLQNVVNAGTGRPASLPDRPAAGKTGTAEGARDLWFIGSIPQLTTAVWFGYDENWRTGSSSATAAAAWYSYMVGILKDIPVQNFPPRPVLTGSFIPYVPPKTPTNSKAPPTEEAPSRRSWETTVDEQDPDRSRWAERTGEAERTRQESRWTPPEPEKDRPRWAPPVEPRPWERPRRSAEPAPEPSPPQAAPAAPAAPQPAAAPAAAPPSPAPEPSAPMPALPSLPVAPPPPLPTPTPR